MEARCLTKEVERYKKLDRAKPNQLGESRLTKKLQVLEYYTKADHVGEKSLYWKLDLTGPCLGKQENSDS